MDALPTMLLLQTSACGPSQRRLSNNVSDGQIDKMRTAE